MKKALNVNGLVGLLTLTLSLSLFADPNGPQQAQPGIFERMVRAMMPGQQAAPAPQAAVPQPVPKEVTYGAELEFFHKNYDWDNDLHGQQARTAKELFRQEILKNCAVLNCKMEQVTGKYQRLGMPDYRVTFPDGWYFTLSHDPGVIEITWKPLSLAELESKKSLIDQAIFQSAKNGGFDVHTDETAHFNIGIKSAFGEKAKDFVRFFVDYHNNNYLALGVLGLDLDNAPPLSVLDQSQRDELDKVVKEVESGEIKTIGQAAEAIFKRVYTKSYNPEWGAELGAEAGPRHYQAVGLKYATIERLAKSDMPMELRAIWAQVDTAHFMKVAKLFEARNRFLKSQTGRIRYLKSAKQEFRTWDEAVTRFYIYVTEAGLKYEDFKSLIPVEAQEVPLATFLDEEAPIEERLKSLNYYRDLFQYSEYFRNYAEALVKKGNAEGVHEQDGLLGRVWKGREADRPMCAASLIL